MIYRLNKPTEYSYGSHKSPTKTRAVVGLKASHENYRPVKIISRDVSTTARNVLPKAMNFITRLFLIIMYAGLTCTTLKLIRRDPPKS